MPFASLYFIAQGVLLRSKRIVSASTPGTSLFLLFGHRHDWMLAKTSDTRGCSIQILVGWLWAKSGSIDKTMLPRRSESAFWPFIRRRPAPELISSSWTPTRAAPPLTRFDIVRGVPHIVRGSLKVTGVLFVCGAVLTLAGCALVGPVRAASPTATAGRAEQDVAPCRSFAHAMTQYSKDSRADSSATGITKAFTTLAFTVGNTAVGASKDSDIQIALQELSVIAAKNADEIRTTGDLSTQENLAFQVAANTAADACGSVRYDFHT